MLCPLLHCLKASHFGQFPPFLYFFSNCNYFMPSTPLSCLPFLCYSSMYLLTFNHFSSHFSLGQFPHSFLFFPHHFISILFPFLFLWKYFCIFITSFCSTNIVSLSILLFYSFIHSFNDFHSLPTIWQVIRSGHWRYKQWTKKRNIPALVEFTSPSSSCPTLYYHSFLLLFSYLGTEELVWIPSSSIYHIRSSLLFISYSLSFSAFLWFLPVGTLFLFS